MGILALEQKLFFQKPLRTTINIFKNKPESFGKILLLDTLFVGFLFFLWFIQTFFEGLIFNMSSENMFIRITSFILVILGELIIITSIYSFFKFWILKIIHNLFQGRKMCSFFSFIKLNFLTFLPILILSLVYLVGTGFYMRNIFLNEITTPMQVILPFLIFLMIALIFFVYFYNLINLFQRIFIQEKDLVYTIKRALIISFKVDSYKMYWSNLKIIFGILFFVAFVDTVFKITTANNIIAYVSYYGWYKKILLITFFLGLYTMVIVNRLAFYFGEKFIHNNT